MPNTDGARLKRGKMTLFTIFEDLSEQDWGGAGRVWVARKPFSYKAFSIFARILYNHRHGLPGWCL